MADIVVFRSQCIEHVTVVFVVCYQIMTASDRGCGCFTMPFVQEWLGLMNFLTALNMLNTI